MELGLVARVPFTLCDVEGYPTNQPATTEPGKLVKGSLERVGSGLML